MPHSSRVKDEKEEEGANRAIPAVCDAESINRLGRVLGGWLVRTLRPVAITGCVLVIASCGQPESEMVDPSESGTTNPFAEKPRPPAHEKTKRTPTEISSSTRQSAPVLHRITRESALVQTADRSETVGLLIRSGAFSLKENIYYCVADTAPDAESVRVSVMNIDRIQTMEGSRTAALPSGLSVYVVQSDHFLSASKGSDIPVNGPVYACLLEAREESPPGSEPLQKLFPVQVAMADSVELLESNAADLEGTMLVANDGSVAGLRRDGRWISPNEILAASIGGPAGIELRVSSRGDSIDLGCNVTWDNTFGTTRCAMVAATTFELESIPGNSVEDRLAKVAPLPMSKNTSGFHANKSLPWNRKPTTLWIKVFEEKEPDDPIIEEKILIDYSDRFVARWGRAPSPLIRVPDAEPDSPVDLVRERLKLKMPGNILDLIPAGDGSVLMVQTDQAPYWSPLDLKTARLEEAPWKSGPDTLLASQAGKVYLIDPKTKVLAIHDLASKQRTGLQILPIESEILAVAAPLTSQRSPILVATEKDVYFIDTEDFELVRNGFTLADSLSTEMRPELGPTTVDPRTAVLRASGDGAFFAVSGRSPSSQGKNQSTTLLVEVDPTLFANCGQTLGLQLMGARGRRVGHKWPDHGGSGIRIEIERNSASFPAPPGSIRFLQGEGMEMIGELRSAPLSPVDPMHMRGSLAYDRSIYFDSSLGVVLLPEDDHLHFLRLNLPQQSQAPPDFLYAGEEVTIPLPSGRDHRFESRPEVEIALVGNVAKIKLPERVDGNRLDLTLEWTGDLGSQLSQSFEYTQKNRSSIPTVESRDGGARVPLVRSGIIMDESDVCGFAGGGHVMLTRSHSSIHAWSLTTSECLFSREEKVRTFLGDMDRLYLMDEKGVLKSFEIASGTPLAEASVGHPSDPRSGLCQVTTGIASRGALIGVEREVQAYIPALIDRDTLQPTLLNIPREMYTAFMIGDIGTNPSGSVFWDGNAAIFWENNHYTVQSFTISHDRSQPDFSGRFLVSLDGIMDLESTNPEPKPFTRLPGFEDGMWFEFDVSGRYLMFINQDSPSTDAFTASIRSVEAPAVELFKVKFPHRISGNLLVKMISDAKKLVIEVNSKGRFDVFDFDVRSIIETLSGPPAKP